MVNCQNAHVELCMKFVCIQYQYNAAYTIITYVVCNVGKKNTLDICVSSPNVYHLPTSTYVSHFVLSD